MKEKRKTRLDKNIGTAEFIGFGAFATAPTTPTTGSTATSTPQQQQGNANKPNWSPVYTGSVDSLQSVFQRISQKRDGVTKTKALNELASLLLTEDGTTTTTAAAGSAAASLTTTSGITKWEVRVNALPHWMWLYMNKMVYEHKVSSVRAASLQVWQAIFRRVPKAVISIATDELWGMWFTAMVDPMQEVRQEGHLVVQMAQQIWDEQQQQPVSTRMTTEEPRSEEKDQISKDPPWCRGVLVFSNRILGYGRPSVMYDALFARKNISGGPTVSAEEQKQDAEERFSYLVGYVLDGLCLLFQDPKFMAGVDSSTNIETDPPNVLFKCMTSPTEALRVRTYRLLSIVASQSITVHLLQSSTLNTLVQSLSTEKNANAWPALLEAFLAVAVARRRDLPTPLWHKGLVKALRKACYGASVAAWGPILLPLTSTLSATAGRDGEISSVALDHALALELIKAAWEGQHVTLGMTEAGRLAVAVSETAYYMLMRPLPPPPATTTSTTSQQQQQQPQQQEAPKEIFMSLAEIWLEVLENALTDQSLATANARRFAWEPLLQGLAKQLQRYQDQSAGGDGNNSNSKGTINAFASIRKEFWTKVSWPCTHPEALAYFVLNLTQGAAPPGKELSQVAKLCFQKILAPFEGDSKNVPSPDVYEAMRALVGYHPKGIVTERFVFNDLLRWIVLHTSQISTMIKKDEVVRADFNLLACVLQATDDPTDWWSTILREVIASQPNLHSLTVGIQVLMKHNQALSWISCDVLDEFAKNIFASTTFSSQDQLDFCQTVLGLKNDNLHRSSNSHVAKHLFDSTSLSAEEEMEFRKTVLGLKTKNQNTGPVVRKLVWEHWIHTYREGSDPHGALSQILLNMTQVPQTAELLDMAGIESIVLQAWLQETQDVDEHHEPGELAGFRYKETMQSIPGMASRIVPKASAEMKRHIEMGDIDSIADWGLRGWRLIQISEFAETPSLSLLGLDQISRWEAEPLCMYELSLSLCHHMDENKCFELLKNTDDHMELFLAILLAVCEASVDLTAAARVGHGHDRTATLLKAIGASSDIEYLDIAIDNLVQKIALALEEGTKNTLRMAAVLAILLRFSFQAIPVPQGQTIAPSDVRAGDRMWYVADPKSPNDLEPVTVVKTHHDSLTGYYFTIEITRSGEKSERQTVIDRLRKTKPEVTSVPADESRRSNVREKIVSKLLKPHFASAGPEKGLGEIVNSLISRVGVGTGRGIGTAHFELFKLLSEEEKTLRYSLEEKTFSQTTKSLWKLALAFGFGRNSELREGSFLFFSVDPVPSHEAIVNLYGDAENDRNLNLDRAVLAWVVVSIPAAQSEEKSTFARMGEVAYTLAKKVLAGEKGKGFTSDRFLAVKALYTARRSLVKRPDSIDSLPSLQASETDAFGAAIESFVCGWDEDDSTIAAENQPLWKLYSDFPALIEDTAQTESGRELLGKASAAHAESLAASLFHEHSRFCTFTLIDNIFGRGEVLRTDQEISLGALTSKRLKEWTQGMDHDAVLELEEDVEVVSQWLPLSMMHELETWHEDTFEDLNETKTIGRLLTWVLVINLIETVAPKDFRARPAFVSYLMKAEIVPAVMNVSILFDETMNSVKSIKPSDDIERLDNEASVTVSNLAKQVIFRSFETVPSLCRRWWEEECPKVYTSRVQSLVERQVAPEILKREMKRLKEATMSFGEMSVSGSLMSREITASYMQDDFTLTVLIRLPGSFPLRSAEVDCSRTLGVPTSRWKRWSLQITLMLNSQGGTLQDALMLWKDNVDKEFEGVEPCPVCYSVLHVKTHKLPSLECTTCHNRFHVDCLTQWFKQSGKSQCVLCQQDWRGARV